MRLLQHRLEQAQARVCELLDLRRRADSVDSRADLEIRLLLAVAGWERINARAEAEGDASSPVALAQHLPMPRPSHD